MRVDSRTDLRVIYRQDVLSPQDRAALVRVQKRDAKAQKALGQPQRRTLHQSEVRYWIIWAATAFCLSSILVCTAVIVQRNARIEHHKIVRAQCEAINRRLQMQIDFFRAAGAERRAAGDGREGDTYWQAEKDVRRTLASCDHIR